MKKLNPFSALLCSLLLASCSVTGIQKHNPNFKTTRELKKMKGSFHVTEVKAVDPQVMERLKSASLTCRLTSFSMPANMTLKDFLQTALTDELDAAEKMSTAGTGISLQVNQIESCSGVDKGTWTLDFLYLVGKKSVAVKTVTEFESAYLGDTACRNTANALSTALADNFASFSEKNK